MNEMVLKTACCIILKTNPVIHKTNTVLHIKQY